MLAFTECPVTTAQLSRLRSCQVYLAHELLRATGKRFRFADVASSSDAQLTFSANI
jgi:hypothetical protein